MYIDDSMLLYFSHQSPAYFGRWDDWDALQWLCTDAGPISQKDTEVVPVRLRWMASAANGQTFYAKDKRHSDKKKKLVQTRVGIDRLKAEFENDPWCFRGIDIRASIDATQACSHSRFPVWLWTDSDAHSAPVCQSSSRVVGKVLRRVMVSDTKSH